MSTIYKKWVAVEFWYWASGDNRHSPGESTATLFIDSVFCLLWLRSVDVEVSDDARAEDNPAVNTIVTVANDWCLTIHVKAADTCHCCMTHPAACALCLSKFERGCFCCFLKATFFFKLEHKRNWIKDISLWKRPSPPTPLTATKYWPFVFLKEKGTGDGACLGLHVFKRPHFSVPSQRCTRTG